MAVEVLEKSAVKRLLTLATAKSRLGISDSSQDTLIGELLDASADAIVSYLGREVGYTRYQETLTRIDLAEYLDLARWPLDSTTLSVTADGTDISADVTAHDSRYGRIYYSGGFRTDERGLVLDYYGGWKMPGQVSDWASATAYSAGDWVRPVADQTLPYLLECTTAGTTGGSEPPWSGSALGDDVTDGTAVWTIREVQELPADLQLAGWLSFNSIYSSLNETGGVTSRRVGDFAETYESPSANVAIGRPATIVGLPSLVRSLLNLYRVPTV